MYSFDSLGRVYDAHDPDKQSVGDDWIAYQEYHRDELASNMRDWVQGEDTTCYHVVAYYPESMKHSPQLIGCIVFTDTNPYTADRVRDKLRMRVARTNAMYFTHDNAFTVAM